MVEKVHNESNTSSCFNGILISPIQQNDTKFAKIESYTGSHNIYIKNSTHYKRRGFGLKTKHRVENKRQVNGSYKIRVLEGLLIPIDDECDMYQVFKLTLEIYCEAVGCPSLDNQKIMRIYSNLVSEKEACIEFTSGSPQVTDGNTYRNAIQGINSENELRLDKCSFSLT
jgi:hypothetical protein